jgi:hypothetical protein
MMTASPGHQTEVNTTGQIERQIKHRAVIQYTVYFYLKFCPRKQESIVY